MSFVSNGSIEEEIVTYMDPLPLLFDPIKMFALPRVIVAAHLVILAAPDSDDELRWGCLTSGNTVDACFGVSSRSSLGHLGQGDHDGERRGVRAAVEAKTYLRHLSQSKAIQHEAIIRFYRGLFTELMDYHDRLESYGVCTMCVKANLQERTVKGVRDALSMLREELKQEGDGEGEVEQECQDFMLTHGWRDAKHTH